MTFVTAPPAGRVRLKFAARVHDLRAGAAQVEVDPTPLEVREVERVARRAGWLGQDDVAEAGARAAADEVEGVVRAVAVERAAEGGGNRRAGRETEQAGVLDDEVIVAAGPRDREVGQHAAHQRVVRPLRRDVQLVGRGREPAAVGDPLSHHRELARADRLGEQAAAADVEGRQWSPRRLVAAPWQGDVQPEEAQQRAGEDLRTPVVPSAVRNCCRIAGLVWRNCWSSAGSVARNCWSAAGLFWRNCWSAPVLAVRYCASKVGLFCKYWSSAAGFCWRYVWSAVAALARYWASPVGLLAMYCWRSVWLLAMYC